MSIKLVIVGGVAGGATCAARARRLDERAHIVLFERGHHISFANCGLPYYIGNVIENRDDLLVTTPESFSARYRIDVRTECQVESIDTANRRIRVKSLIDNRLYEESYDRLILSPGAEPLKPPIPGIDSDRIFHLRNIPDSDRIKGFIDQQKPGSAVVVGAGFIGLEMAENLVERGVKTTIVERLDQVMPPLDYEMASIVQATLKEKGVICELNNGVSEFIHQDDHIVVRTQKGRDIACDLVILSVGIRPESRIAAGAGLEIGETGGIIVDATMRTSDPNIYAVGDAVQVRDLLTGIPKMTALAGPANRQGRIAADNALGRKSVFRGTIGTSIVKVFELTVASTGASEKTLRQYNLPYIVSYTHSGSHASYYPGADLMSIKLLAAPNNGKILGAQIVGAEGVDKRIDVLATAVSASMTVFDLEELELAYAPPYSSAKDPVNIAGFVAANILKGDMDVIYWHELGIVDDDTMLIDLRNKDELDESGAIEGALHIPLPELRDRMADLDKNKTYILYCAVGMRGYLGYRILTQNGFTCKNLSGGYKTYLGAEEKIMKESRQTPIWLSE